MNQANAVVFVSVLLVCLGCDQATKSFARETLADRGTISLAADTVRFDLALNPGGFMSLGARLPEPVRQLAFVAIVPLLLLATCLMVIRAGLSSRVEWAALALLASGGIGNWLDRVLQSGVVTDFVSLGFGSLRTGIFNVADVAVMAGAALLLSKAWHPPESRATSL